MPGSDLHLLEEDGVRFRDLNGNGRLDPYEDPRLSVTERVQDLVGRLSIEEKAGLLFQTVIEAGHDGDLLETPGMISKSPTSHVVLGKHMNHFNVHALRSPTQAATWHNALQRLAEQTPHGIPVTISTDPRHTATQNAGASWSSSFLSQWPEPLGLGAIGDPEVVRRYADTVRREYTAIGIRSALHPTADLATEPRWARQRECFGADPVLVASLTEAVLQGLAGPPDAPAVAATVKHFPGAGPQADGEDAHFPYGRDQTYPGGRFEDHLEPFRRAITAGTAQMMPYYGRPIGLEVGGEEIEPVGFGFNRQMITGLLREQLGFDGVIVTDWELVQDNHVGEQVLPARAWGVEHLSEKERMQRIFEAGADQLGGEECVHLMLELIAEGTISEERIDESVRRVLRVKFELGLFDDPFVEVDAAATQVGRPEDIAAGRRTQAESVVVLHDHVAQLPVRTDAEPNHRSSQHSTPAPRVYIEGIDPEEARRVGAVVDRPEDADLALIRIGAPFEPRDDLFLESWFHQGSLEFGPGLAVRLARISEHCRLILDVDLDRAAVLTPLVDVVDTLTGTFGINDAAWIDAITGEVAPRGKLPIELPRSMEAVRRSWPDAAGTGDPLYPLGHGLHVAGEPLRDQFGSERI